MRGTARATTAPHGAAQATTAPHSTARATMAPHGTAWYRTGHHGTAWHYELASALPQQETELRPLDLERFLNLYQPSERAASTHAVLPPTPGEQQAGGGTLLRTPGTEQPWRQLCWAETRPLPLDGSRDGCSSGAENGF